MPGKTTAGFTKSAQKDKFVRNRDIQLKSVEIKKEQRIQQGMVEGKVYPTCLMHRVSIVDDIYSHVFFEFL
jgi:hypothetical protein